ncbi:hypothetical protein ACH44C_26545 [Streptomyces purpureus]|uniref:LppU/SCO3897 family protein n=1 Tax=Streptomyces purpureus TaxID=1951 RepID=UPI0037889585
MGAFFLGLLVSVVVSLLYTGVVLFTYKEQSVETAQILYVAHGLLNGAAVGLVTGLMARGRAGAWAAGALVAALGAFFGYTNAVPLIIAEQDGVPAIGDMMEIDPLIPAKAWWGANGDAEWIALLGLVVAAGTAWVLAHLVGKRSTPLPLPAPVMPSGPVMSSGPAMPQGPGPVPPSAPVPPSGNGGGGVGAKTILKGVGVVAGLVVLAVGYFLSQDDADHAKAGDCLKNNGTTVAPDLQVVECGGAEAVYKVVEVIPDTLETSRCEGRSDIGYQEQTRGGRRSSGKQFVLCLDEIKK